jgi:hypothetical protein
MKIITSYPIIKNGKVVANNCYNTTLDYSSVTGGLSNPVFSQNIQKAANVASSKGGASATKTGRNIDFESLGDKASAGIKGLGNLVGLFKKPKGTAAPTTAPPAQMPENQGMTTGTKIAIGLGAVAVIGALIYFAKK